MTLVCGLELKANDKSRIVIVQTDRQTDGQNLYRNTVRMLRSRTVKSYRIVIVLEWHRTRDHGLRETQHELDVDCGP